MPQTEFEKSILRKRERSGVLVPLLEELFQQAFDVEDEADRNFLVDLLERRGAQRHERGHYSPSMLGNCIRATYFAKTGKKRSRVVDPRSNGYFAQGNFMHLKWQFALWKLHRAGKLTLIAVEPYVENKRGDFSGHIDAIIEIGGVIYLVDFKGYQPRVYKQIVGGYIPADAAIQLTGYMMIVSAGKTFDFKVDKSLLVVESKSGPDEKGSPLGIVEVEIHRKTWIKVTKAKLDELREYEENEETPPPACHSTRQRGFQTCPWSGFCLEEVREIQRRESSARRNPDELSVAVPEGRGATNSRRSRRGKR